MYNGVPQRESKLTSALSAAAINQTSLREDYPLQSSMQLGRVGRSGEAIEAREAVAAFS
jgi:hypothetical protein